MTLVKKGSRYIDIDGTTYRWRLRGKPTYSQGNCWSSMTFAVERAEEPGMTLVVDTGRPHTANWSGVPTAPVLPTEVTRAVRKALAAGWQPGRRGSAFQLNLSQRSTK
ncbi:hypothetical protein JOF56_003232 [Kibdelosporangium banguiense]|uniref:Uncharacterized protein n=1 Tax=Kibdelosporangium banguiense TaxID=1365924 RepID=A0ABS4TEK2_9PSEU|nr:hypothetical protein [Kibdelosporangium banguiense]MBP2322847.1 hypothetical protein [Kibdelosporangium banguiense]